MYGVRRGGVCMCVSWGGVRCVRRLTWRTLGMHVQISDRQLNPEIAEHVHTLKSLDFCMYIHVHACCV